MKGIVISGYGKMGHEIERLAKLQGIPVLGTIDTEAELKKFAFPEGAIVIDFSEPKAILKNIDFYTEKKLNAVVGTTGWYDHVNDVKKKVEASGIGFLYGSNFALGVQAFFKIAEYTAKTLNKLTGYDAAITETHHIHKKDAPSGTALTIGQILVNGMDNKKKIITAPPEGREVAGDELLISAVRLGEAAGDHTALFDSEADSITLSHHSKGRAGFAKGALMAAKWLDGKKGFYNVTDMIGELFK